MPSFRTFSELGAYIKNNVAEVIPKSPELERVLETAMRNAVISEVYNAYKPEKYKRRGDDGGLSDPRNFRITGVNIIGSQIHIAYENLTQGADNLSGKYIGDLIEFGDGHNGKTWGNSNGDWAQPRPFAQEATRQLKDNPSGLKRAIRKALSDAGFKVR